MPATKRKERQPSGFCTRRLAAAVSVLIFVAALVFLLANTGALHAYVAASRAEVHGSTPLSRDSRLVHVCFSTDDTDLRALYVAVKTACQHAAQPSRLRFHVLTSEEVAPMVRAMSRDYLQEASVQVHVNEKLRERIDGLTRFERHTWSTIREERLYSAFNWVPFFLPEFLSLGRDSESSGDGAWAIDASRLIYLDTDVVVLGDLAELSEVELHGHAVAATSDCAWQYQDALPTQWLRRQRVKVDGCVVSRGVALLDVPRWKALRVSDIVEGWIVYMRNITGDLWNSPLPASAWLLMLNASYYQELDMSWSCQNLGRDFMSSQEGYSLRHGGFDGQSFVDLGAWIDDARGNTTPFISTCTGGGGRAAKLLHFNGPLKPWTYEAWRERNPGPICARPRWFSLAKASWSKVAVIRGKRRRFVRCHDLWTVHLPDNIDCVLKNIDGEWMEDERVWLNRQRIAAKKKKDEAEQMRKEREKAEEERRSKAEQQSGEKVEEAKVV